MTIKVLWVLYASSNVSLLKTRIPSSASDANAPTNKTKYHNIIKKQYNSNGFMYYTEHPHERSYTYNNPPLNPPEYYPNPYDPRYPSEYDNRTEYTKPYDSKVEQKPWQQPQQRPQQYWPQDEKRWPEESWYPENSWSRFDRRVYLDDLSPYNFGDEEQAPQKFEIRPPDWNSPSNYPYVPLKDPESLLDHEVNEFVHRLPRYTKHPEEIAFARYLAESILIDQRLNPLQEQLNHDMRFNSRLLFDYFDAQKLGHLDFNEFKWGLNKLDIHFKNEECYNLFERVSNEDQRISSLEFNELLVGPRDQPSKFYQYGAFHYMHLPFNRHQQDQYLTVLQRDLINEIVELQLKIERNLTSVRMVVGVTDDILFALFRQLDLGGKGYLVIEDLLRYLQDLGAGFVQVRHLENAYCRISKLHGDRINFNEFSQEFHINTHNKLIKERETNMSPTKTRQNDYIERLKKNQQELQEQQRHPVPHPVGGSDHHEYAQFTPTPVQQPQAQYPQPPPPKTKQEQPRPVQEQPPPQKKSTNDISDLFFPGFTKYQLKKPQPPIHA